MAQGNVIVGEKLGREERRVVRAVELFEKREAARLAPRPAPRPAQPAQTPRSAQDVARVLGSFAALQSTFEWMQERVAEVRLALEAMSPEAGRSAEPDVQDAADILCSLRQKAALGPQRSGPRKKRRSDVGRKVVVLWVPEYFPEEQEPELADLVPYRGVVVKHARVRKEGTHCVQYEDRQCRWHKLDKLFKFLD
jgi:hypothetical protein